MNDASEPVGPPSRRGRPPRGDAEAIEQRILAVASQLILEKGAARMTIDDVAAAAHASKTTVYSRFPTKDDLFDGFARWFTEQHLALLFRHPDAVAPAAEESALERLLEHVTLPEQVRFLRALIAEGERRSRSVSDAHRRLRDGYTRFLMESAGITRTRADDLLRTQVARRQLESLMSYSTQGNEERPTGRVTPAGEVHHDA